jgi:hypothetical protein
VEALRTPDERFADLVGRTIRNGTATESPPEAFSDGDPITGGGDRVFQKLVPGAQGLPHATLAATPAP